MRDHCDAILRAILEELTTVRRLLESRAGAEPPRPLCVDCGRALDKDDCGAEYADGLICCTCDAKHNPCER